MIVNSAIISDIRHIIAHSRDNGIGTIDQFQNFVTLRLISIAF